MTLIVEDGTGKPDANGYISVAFADAFWASFADATWAAATLAAKEAAIAAATSYIDTNFLFIGRRLTRTQALDWPRSDVIDPDGFGIAASEVPIEVMNATARLAREALSADLMPVMSPGRVKRVRQKVDVIETETEYTDTGLASQNVFEFVAATMRGLISSAPPDGGLAIGSRTR